MAKSNAKAAAGSLAGKTVAFVGKFNYANMHLPPLKLGAEQAGGKVVEAANAPDVLVYGDGRGGNPPGEVVKVQKKNPAVLLFNVADFVKSIIPTADEFIAMLGAGKRESEWWEAFTQLLWIGGTSLDLRGADLRKTVLDHADFKRFKMDGADVRGAHAEWTKFGDIANVNFDGINGPHLSIDSGKGCTFRKANIEEMHVWAHNNRASSGCDFSHAKMKGFYSRYNTMTDCRFVGADMREAEINRAAFTGSDFTDADLTFAEADLAKFENAVLAGAKLQGADLRQASFKKADLRNADLRGAVLSEADFTGANVAGADFAGAVLTGAKIKGLDVTKAKNFTPPVPRTAGEKLAAFAAAAKGSKSFTTSVEVDTADGGVATLQIVAASRGCSAYSIFTGKKLSRREEIAGANIEAAMLNASERWPGASPRFETVQAKGGKSLRGKELVKAASAAWAEVFGTAVLSEDEAKKQKDKRDAKAVKERDKLVAAIRSKGIEAWNALGYQEKKQFTDFRGVDFSKLNLEGITFYSDTDMEGCDFSGSNLSKASFHVRSLAGANFTKADLRECQFLAKAKDAIFDGANLREADFEHSSLEGSRFKKSDLTGADLSRTKLQGADFTGAKLDGANLAQAEYDETTILPAGFEPPIAMVWKGAPKPVAPVAVGSLDFPTFLAELGAKVEDARMKKASAMLKAEKFQLFSDVTENGFVGIVKSQSSKDLVYSCRLTSDGDFGCCTQNLMACGGLRGALCKHLLVLTVGLTKAGLLDPATVNAWVDRSRSKKPVMDKDSQSESFLKYKGAEAGELDWRPTETIPEDFYAM